MSGPASALSPSLSRIDMATRGVVMVVAVPVVVVATANGGFHLFLAHAPKLPAAWPKSSYRIPHSAFRFPLVACRLSNQFVRNHWQLLTAKTHTRRHSRTHTHTHAGKDMGGHRNRRSPAEELSCHKQQGPKASHRATVLIFDFAIPNTLFDMQSKQYRITQLNYYLAHIILHCLSIKIWN